MESIEGDWRSVKEKPKEFMRVEMKCCDGKIRWGTFEPDGYITPWVYENECLESPFDMPGISHWRPI
ncbi:MAG: hypothetical protein WC089_03905 [Candidatus Paceibacterota bacterium]